MKVDLHVHARPDSQVAMSGLDDVLEAAASRGVGAVALISTGFVRSADSWGFLYKLGRVHGLVVFSGALVRTTFGEILIYGLDEEVRFGSVVDTLALLEWVRQKGGATVAAHPLRGLESSRRESIRLGRLDWCLRVVDALELCWATCRDEDEPIEVVARRLAKPVVRASGACWAGHVGRFSEEIPEGVRSGKDLAAWIRDQTRG